MRWRRQMGRLEMVLERSLLVALVLFAGCERETPVPTQDVASCAVALASIGNRLDTPGTDPLADYARGCAGLYREKGCREAWARVAAADPLDASVGDRRISELAGACRDAYCPLFAEPKPSLCATPDLAAPNLELHGWPELHREILERDLKAQPELARALGKLFTPSVASVPLAPTASVASAAQTVLTVELHANGDLLLDGQRLLDDEQMVAAARAALAKNGDIRAVIRADRAVQHGEVVRVLDLLKQAGISKIAFGVTPVAP